MTILFLLIALCIILVSAELFTNGVEWFGRRYEMGEGAVGSILAAGPLVVITGRLHDNYGCDWTHAWMIVMGLLGGTMALLGLWHAWNLPEGEPSSLHGGGMAGAWLALKESWVTFFQKKSIWLMLLVIFMYRFGEGFIENFGPLFLMDPRAVGGMGFNNQAIGGIYNTYGTIGFLAGALLGGLFAARFTLRRSFFFLAVALNVPHVTHNDDADITDLDAYRKDLDTATCCI